MMQTQTIVLIVLAFFAAFGLSYIQYLYKAKTKHTYVFVLAFLRFLTFFTLFILLVNPVIQLKSWYTEKVVLPVLIDNSQSVALLDSTFTKTNWDAYFKNQTELNKKFQVVVYPFDAQLHSNGSKINFKGKTTQISQAATQLNELYRNSYQPILLITDGNQTQGSDYVYAFNPNAKVFPVIVGDTAFVYDAQIFQANSNKYVFVNNQFPIEIFANVVTQKSTKVDLVITNENKQVYKKTYELTPEKNSLNEVVYLTANEIGVKKYKVQLITDQAERNIQNNSKTIAIDVIDQKTEIALVSAMVHPDLGALKRSIEKNEHHKVTILKPNQTSNIQNYDLLILYQPINSFATVWKQIQQTHKNYWLIGGMNTDYLSLNQNQSDFLFKLYNQPEQYMADKNTEFSVFEVPNLSFANLPYLDFPFGTIETKTKQTPLLYLKTRGIKTDMPMLTFAEVLNQKKVYWFGENLWKWRIETANENDYFYQLTDKIIQYLAIKSPKQNLIVELDNLYNQTDVIQVVAQFFNKNLEYDTQAILQAELLHIDTKNIKKYNFSKRTNEAFLHISDLEPGKYQLKVIESKSKKQVIKTFEVLAFNAELQAIQANVKQLKILAQQSKGESFLIKDIDKVVKQLVNDTDYLPTQKEIISKQALIDWPWLLILILILVIAEWFIRKYNGLK